MRSNSSSGLPRWVWAAGCLLLFSVIICAGGIIAAGALLFVTDSSTEVGVTANAPSVNEEGDPQITVPGTGEPTSDPDDLRDQIEAEVVEIRGLQPRRPVTVTFLSTGELRQRLEEDFAEDYSLEEAQDDAIALSAFDFLEADFDLYNFLIDLLTEQIAGFYDAETDEFVIIGDDTDFGALEQLTHAHEYVHALQDQHHDLDALDDEDLSDDASLALTALAEGDATLVQMRYMISGAISREDMLGLLDDALAIDTQVLDSAPPVLANELSFPYTAGLEFAQYLHGDAGFSGLEDAWENPPQSSEQIIHPVRYLNGDAPQVVAVAPLTDTLGGGWRLVDENVLGEFYLREYLAQQLDEQAVDRAATGWGGDRYAVYWHEGRGEVAMVLRLAWDTPEDRLEFAEAYTTYPSTLLDTQPAVESDGGTCWQDGEAICLYELASDSLVIRAPDIDLARQMAAVQRP